MADNASDVQSMLTHHLRPALVLDAQGVVIAANNGSRRLIHFSQPAAPIIGQDISQLGLVLQRRPPTLSSWSKLLDAAVHVPRLDEPHHATTANSFHLDTDEFWDAESVRQAIVESNVRVTHRKGENDSENEDNSSTVRARAIVHWLPQGDKGLFLVTFDRPSTSDRLAPGETVSELSDGVDDIPHSSERSSDVHAEDSQSNTMPISQLGSQNMSSNEKVPLAINEWSSASLNVSSLKSSTQFPILTILDA
jgi:hypothetical protein